MMFIKIFLFFQLFLNSFLFSPLEPKGRGMKLLTRFLLEDNEVLKDKDGIYDETGRDGLDDSEETYTDGSEERYKQRARSISMLWIRQNPKYRNYEPYGCKRDKEEINGWNIFNVLIMNPKGSHFLKKVCLANEHSIISFVINVNELCVSKVKVADELIEKGNSYLEKNGGNGFAKLIPFETNEKFNKKTKIPEISLPPLLEKEKTNYNLDENLEDSEQIQKKIDFLQNKLKEITKKSQKDNINENKNENKNSSEQKNNVVQTRFLEKEKDIFPENTSNKDLLDLFDEKINS